MTDDHVDVAVVGCGPVGATFTGLLARRGLRVAAFEREADVYHLPRADGALAAGVRPDRYVFGLARARGDLDTLTAVLTTPGL
jgi:2-polyprenyl-6-methoxyphenol hydroxylase-like FAD-dependent oxidoreductase